MRARPGRQPKFANERFAKLAKELFEASPNALVAWLDKHPEIDWIVWRSGNRPNSRKMLRHHGEKFLGNYTYLNLYDLMSQVPSFPSDVWRLVETKTMEPLAFVDRAEVTDPEGTAFGYDVDEEMAKRWDAGVYNQGHLYMYPAQATGRFPYSIIEYPDDGRLLPAAGPAGNHRRDRIDHQPRRHPSAHGDPDREGTGQGDQGRRPLRRGHSPAVELSGLERVAVAVPEEARLLVALRSRARHQSEILQASGAKCAEGNNLSERNVAGVVHWALGSEVAMGPDKVGEWAAESEAFTSQREHPAAQGPRACTSTICCRPCRCASANSTSGSR